MRCIHHLNITVLIVVLTVILGKLYILSIKTIYIHYIYIYILCIYIYIYVCVSLYNPGWSNHLHGTEYNPPRYPPRYRWGPRTAPDSAAAPEASPGHGSSTTRRDWSPWRFGPGSDEKNTAETWDLHGLNGINTCLYMLMAGLPLVN